MRPLLTVFITNILRARTTVVFTHCLVLVCAVVGGRFTPEMLIEFQCASDFNLQVCAEGGFDDHAAMQARET